MATEWGPVADWVGASVTFLGFVGAIAALKVQRKSVDAQLEQHNKTKSDEEEAQRKKAEALGSERLEKKEKDARAVKLTVSAARPKAPPGSKFVDKPSFVVTCGLVFPTGNLKYTDVGFEVPDKELDGFGFREVMDDRKVTKSKTVNGPARLTWQISGDYWPHGSEADAKAWVAARTFATFKDPSGIEWKLDGNGKLVEVSKSVHVG
ncbi:hypothetical protein GCM10027405_39430 [Arthrobacter alkaliphilus]|uniref:hypothetical protein n=1 Tax=Arthrobacter alkaliphilus TaxID=369936 RepID=UPI001F2287C4|nr:hypothetical protein [Arthrobacter alkaliphilus]